MSSPPHSLAPLRFAFPALASLAGRAPLGGPRETALASLQIARLVRDALDPGFDVAARAARAVTTRSWLAAIALPRPLRPVLVRVVDASAADGAHAAAELRSALPLLATYLDEAARAELAHLAGADLTDSMPVTPVQQTAARAVTPARPAESRDSGVRGVFRPRARAL